MPQPKSSTRRVGSLVPTPSISPNGIASRSARAAHHVTAAAGGFGCAREFCDLLLMAAGRYEALLNGVTITLDGSPG